MSTAEPRLHSELPEYSASTSQSQRAGVQHEYSLEQKGLQWLKLIVSSSRSANSKSLPFYFDEDEISGSVEIDLKKAENIKAIAVSVTAGTTSVGQEEVQFLNLSQELWTSSSSGGLQGQHSWPFSINLPAQVSISQTRKGPPASYRLPPSFSERASAGYIDYKLVVTVRRGALRVNSTLATSFACIPRAYADPPSSLRQLAYSKGSAIPGPELDPDGWKVLAPATIKGTMFGTKEVEIKCTLAIATPLTHAIGAPLPLVLTISSSEKQAVDLLSAAASIRLFLVRTIAVGSDALNAARMRSDNSFRESCGRAFCWPLDEPGEGTKRLHGEIEIPKNLKPSFSFPNFVLKYAITLLPFQAPGFVSAVSKDDALLTEEVSIVTTNARGVTPRSYAPPGYVLPNEGSYNNVVGVLENGNQRFLEHGHALG